MNLLAKSDLAPNLAVMALPDGLVPGAVHVPGALRQGGIMFADISGSMLLYEALGAAAALSVIEQCLGIVARVGAQNRGTVVKTMGDEIMMCFAEPLDIWLAAIEAQERIGALPPVRTDKGPVAVSLRVGLDFGELLESAGDMYGNTVNVAARMTELAKRGQIMTTIGLVERLPRGHRFRMRTLDWVPVKGVPDGVQVMEVLWAPVCEASSTIVAPSLLVAGAPENRSELVLSMAGREWRFDARASRLSLGRDAGNDVVVPGSAASRSHATIERRRERWVLIDHSSNGTFVSSPGQARDVHLRREEFTLGSEGQIGFGDPTDGAPQHVMTFAVSHAP